MKAPLFKMTRTFYRFAAGIVLLLSQSCVQKTLTLSSETPQPPVENMVPPTATNSPQQAKTTATTNLPSATIPLLTSTPTDRTLPPQFMARLNLGWIEEIALSPQGDWLAAAGASYICLFDIANFEQVWGKPTELPPQYEVGSPSKMSRERLVLSLAFHPDGGQIAYALWNGYIVFMDTTTGQRVNVMESYFQSSISYLAWSQDGRQMIVRSYEHGIEVWDTSTGEKEGHLEIDPASITSVAWSPDSSVLAIGLSEEGKIALWDTALFEQIGSVEIASPGNAYSLAWSPDGNYLYTSIIATMSGCGGQCTEDVGWIKAWNMTTGELAFEIDMREDIVASLVVSEDGRWIAAVSGYGRLQILDSATGNVTANLTDIDPEKGTAWLGSKRLFFVPYPSDPYGNVILKSIGQLDMATGVSTDLLLPGFENIYSLAWMPDGERLVTNSAGGTVSIWQASTGQRLEQLQLMLGDVPLNSFGPASISPVDGRLATPSQGSIAIVDIESRQVPQIMEYRDITPETHVGETSWSRDGKKLVGQVYESGGTTVVVWDVQTGKLLLTIPVGYSQNITSLALSPDGARLALGWSSQGKERLVVWDIELNEEVVSIDMPCPVRELSWFTQNQVAFTTKGWIEIWDLTTVKQLRKLAAGFFFAISPDSSLAASEYLKEGITISDFRSGKELANLKTETGHISSLAFSPDGKLLASLSDHGSVIIWDMSEFYSR